MRRTLGVAMFGLGAMAAFVVATSPARAQSQAQPELPIPLRFPPRTLPYEDGVPIPPGYHLEQRVMVRDVALGAAMFGAAWLPSAIAAAAVVGARQPDAPRISPLAIPIAGPFITITTAHAHPAGGVILALDGIAQVGGVTLLIAGLAMKEPILVLNPIPASAARIAVGPGTMSVVGSF